MDDVLEGPWRVDEVMFKGYPKLVISQDRDDDEVAIAICSMTGGHVAMRATADYIVELVNRDTAGGTE